LPPVPTFDLAREDDEPDVEWDVHVGETGPTRVNGGFFC
jgi:hypothetical protein